VLRVVGEIVGGAVDGENVGAYDGATVGEDVGLVDGTAIAATGDSA